MRVLIEDYIMMKYLVKNESFHENIWRDYQLYGMGLYKLVLARHRENGALEESHFDEKYIEALVNEFKGEEFIDRFDSFRQKMSGPAGVVNDLWINVSPIRLYHPINRQTIPNEPSDRYRRKELSFILLEPLVQQLFKEIAQELMLGRIDNSVFLKQLHHLNENLSVLIEQFFIVDIFEREFIIRIEF